MIRLENEGKRSDLYVHHYDIITLQYINYKILSKRTISGMLIEEEVV